ncbi:MAG: hypothetical protein K5917_07125, partial [Clostridiales bacterium]|nr:hypothetical protein [Clostridiales bacterium]
KNIAVIVIAIICLIIGCVFLCLSIFGNNTFAYYKWYLPISLLFIFLGNFINFIKIVRQRKSNKNNNEN